eukprot:2736150-Rhodomonas_salina.1
MVLCGVRYCDSVRCYAVCGTEIAYGEVVPHESWHVRKRRLRWTPPCASAASDGPPWLAPFPPKSAPIPPLS